MSDSDKEVVKEETITLTKAELEQKLKEAEDKGFAEGFGRTRNTVTHEVANRVAPARGYAELLLKSEVLSDRAKGMLEKVVESTKEIAGFLDELNYAMPEKVKKVDLMGKDGVDLKSASSKIGGRDEYTDFT